MKKYALYFLVILMFFTFFGCQKEDVPTPASGGVTPPSATQNESLSGRTILCTYKRDDWGHNYPQHFASTNIYNEGFIEGTDKATVYSETTQETYAFTSIADAWEYVNIHTGDVLSMHIYEDWIAETSEDGTTSFGTGKGYRNGAICPEKRTAKLSIELLEHTISRNGTKPMKSGEVFNLTREITTLYLRDGTITGGYNKTSGGAIYQKAASDNDIVILYNMTITGNYAGDNGGGIYTAGGNVPMDLRNTTVTGNTAGGYGGGVYVNDDTVLSVSSVTVVKDNVGKDNRSNITLRKHWFHQSYLYLDGLETGSEIYVSNSNNNTDYLLAEGIYADEAEFFYSDFPNRTIHLNERGAHPYNGTPFGNLYLK